MSYISLMASGKHLINSTHIVSRCIKFANANRKVRRVNMERWTPTNLRDPVPTPPLGPAAKIQPLGSMEDTTWHSGNKLCDRFGMTGMGQVLTHYDAMNYRYHQISMEFHGYLSFGYSLIPSAPLAMSHAMPHSLLKRSSQDVAFT